MMLGIDVDNEFRRIEVNVPYLIFYRIVHAL